MKRVREEDRTPTVTPSMARDSQFPAAAIEAWNRMILNNFSDGLAVVSKLAVAKSLGWTGGNKHPAWLRPKAHFEKFGWRVEEDADGDTVYFSEVLNIDTSMKFSADPYPPPPPPRGRVNAGAIDLAPGGKPVWVTKSIFQLDDGPADSK